MPEQAVDVMSFDGVQKLVAATMKVSREGDANAISEFSNRVKTLRPTLNNEAVEAELGNQIRLFSDRIESLKARL